VDGLKTGHVAGAGYHLVLTARRDGTRVVVVVLGSRTSGARFREARMLLEDAFRKIQPHPAARRVAGGPAIPAAGDEVPVGRSAGGVGDS